MSYSGALVPLFAPKTFQAPLSNAPTQITLQMQQFRNVDLMV